MVTSGIDVASGWKRARSTSMSGNLPFLEFGIDDLRQLRLADPIVR